MRVELAFNSPLILAIRGARTCYDSLSKSDSIPCMKCDGKGCKECFNEGYNYGEKDLNLIRRLIRDGHHSVFEHIYYTFDIQGISRALLQELVRHRIASYSVKSTRYTLKELKKANRSDLINFLVSTGHYDIDRENLLTLETVIVMLYKEYPNDVVKYLLPEAFKTNVFMTINARSLRNLLELRTSKKALKEFQELAKMIYGVIPEPHKFIFEDVIKVNDNE